MLGQRREIENIASSTSPSMACTFHWSLSKLGEFLVAEGVVDDISHEGLRVLLREEGVDLSPAENLEDLGLTRTTR